jgi:hypothetical protein
MPSRRQPPSANDHRAAVDSQPCNWECSGKLAAGTVGKRPASRWQSVSKVLPTNSLRHAALVVVYVKVVNVYEEEIWVNRPRKGIRVFFHNVGFLPPVVVASAIATTACRDASRSKGEFRMLANGLQANHQTIAMRLSARVQTLNLQRVRCDFGELVRSKFEPNLLHFRNVSIRLAVAIHTATTAVRQLYSVGVPEAGESRQRWTSTRRNRRATRLSLAGRLMSEKSTTRAIPTSPVGVIDAGSTAVERSWGKGSSIRSSHAATDCRMGVSVYLVTDDAQTVSILRRPSGDSILPGGGSVHCIAQLHSKRTPKKISPKWPRSAACGAGIRCARMSSSVPW